MNRSVFSLLLSLLLFCACAHSAGPMFAPEPPSEEITTTLPKPFDTQSSYLAIMGDVQTYVSKSDYLPLFTHTMQWLRSAKACGAQLEALLFVGDLTDNNSRYHWQLFRRNMLIAGDSITTVACTGNHDYYWDRGGNHYTAIRTRQSTRLTRHLTTSLLRCNIIDSFMPDSLDNLVVRTNIPNDDICIMSLEFAPRPEVLDWAARHLASHPEHKYIVMTHELLQRDGTLCPDHLSYGRMQFSVYGVPHSTPAEVCRRLAFEHPNVIAMLCGHNGFSAFNTDYTNCEGRTVPIVLFNLQYCLRGGNGLVELWEFPHHKREVNVRVYDTLNDKFLSGDATTFHFTY